ncbi:hypothetical protein [Sinosporangium album]|uniref:hypothetical protein n=1 Tax=Sinosporangium album TaxID=504805 RepID=UPI00115FB1D2|nr:hypothetical protein [Sinosporangium album]
MQAALAGREHPTTSPVVQDWDPACRRQTDLSGSLHPLALGALERRVGEQRRRAGVGHTALAHVLLPPSPWRYGRRVGVGLLELVVVHDQDGRGGVLQGADVGRVGDVAGVPEVDRGGPGSEVARQLGVSVVGTQLTALHGAVRGCSSRRNDG